MIREHLKPGKANAISTPELLSLTGLKNVRDLRHAVSRERREGAVILSCCAGGYYLAADRGEIEEFIRMQDKKARSTMFALKSARKYLKTLDGQMIMEA